jgi:hypothetical protein
MVDEISKMETPVAEAVNPTVSEPAKAPETTVKPEKTVEQPEKPLTRAELQTLFAEMKEQGRRQGQSEQDLHVRDAIRARKQAEEKAKAYEKILGGEDLPEETKLKLKLAQYQSAENVDQSFTQEEQVKQQFETHIKRVREQSEKHLETLGIKKDDARIDWAVDAPDYVTGKERFDASLAKIIKETSQSESKKVSDLEKRLRDLETKLGAEPTLDSVNTAEHGGAVVSDSDKEFMRKIGANEINLTKANLERYNKILNS